ncbi:MAG: hypothetical protein J0I20_02840 [Chloroflexi bacterium]|nr:hypothetical protein [Chloroflexota bacterium]OJV89300.1 MAG: hypothetical protein BGO39_35510 [Chloroflexi bacterium 54-19]
MENNNSIFYQNLGDLALEEKLEALLKKLNLSQHDLTALLKSFHGLGLQPQVLRKEIIFALGQGNLSLVDFEHWPQLTRLIDLVHILTFALAAGKL